MIIIFRPSKFFLRRLRVTISLCLSSISNLCSVCWRGRIVQLLRGSWLLFCSCSCFRQCRGFFASFEWSAWPTMDEIDSGRACTTEQVPQRDGRANDTITFLQACTRSRR